MSQSSATPGADHRAIGYLLVLVGLLINKWSVERLVSVDEHIGSAALIAPIVAFQILCVLMGAMLIARPFVGGRTWPFNAAKGLLLAILGLGIFGTLKAVRIVDPNRDFRQAWQAMEVSEELIRVLTPQLGRLSGAVMNLELPDHHTREMFDTQVAVLDLADVDPAERASPLRNASLSFGDWALASTEGRHANADLTLWQPLLKRADYFDHAKMSIVRGRFLDGRDDAYQIDVAFEALARLASGTAQWVKRDIQIDWRRRETAGGPITEELGPPAQADVTLQAEEEAAAWVITRFETVGLRLTESDRSLFADVLASALDEADLVDAQRSIHEELILEMLLDPEAFEEPHQFFDLPAFDRHPGLAVVDLDRDGYDDVYVMARWGPNQFFRNRGDGTFDEVAEELGLDFEDHSSSAIFADFDNDGDRDAYLGRTLAKSLYLENDGGRFTDKSDSMPEGALPYLVSSVSAVDYDRDGLLDLYLSTYASAMLYNGEGGIFEYLSEGDALELNRLTASGDSHRNLNRPGPPNVLLRNEGQGHFSVVEEASALRVFKNTYQTTWADYDGDGDQDAYIANDFAPNHFVRNDGGGQFVDITDETGTADLGFGMGASWGDYDEDGQQDLYVSNMFSKAGTRITEQLAGLDERFGGMARGNSLFQNGTDGFAKVSGVAPPAFLVEKAGWGWGSQFVDVDNDGYLDLYALSGYYTAPEEVELPFDI